MSAELYVKHIDKFYNVNIEKFGIDFIVCYFSSESEYSDFFSSFHKKGDVNYIDGEYYQRSDVKSYKYEILLKNIDKFGNIQGYYILEVMGVDYDWGGLDIPSEDLSANIYFLNGDSRSKEEYDKRFREIKIDKLLVG